MSYTMHESAYVDQNAVIGDNTKIWHNSVVRAGAQIGRDCVLGQNIHVASTAQIGNGVRIQNNVSVFDGVILEDFVFCGPGVLFTNVLFPRSQFPRAPEEYRPTRIRHGATLGAGSIIIAGVEIGEYAFVAAGAVVTHDVPDHAAVMGMPARQTGWACDCGLPLDQALNCSCGRSYRIGEHGLVAQPSAR
ncbi:MAG: DapH/DapD/GlmU-related protein [Oscillospiraceae bacterium]